MGLHVGMRGRAVREVQNALIRHGVKILGGADGIYGLRTLAAVKAFQRINGLNPHGFIDAPTASALGLQSTISLPSTGSGGGLHRGMRGVEIKELQRALVRAGFRLAGGIDGIFGPSTELAVKSFQRSHGISPTGIVGPITSRALGLTGGSPAPSPSPSPSSGLRQGDRGPLVRAVQRAIVRAGGYLRGGIDGVYGPGTTAAVKAYQIVNRLPVTGVVDAATARIMGVKLTGNGGAPRRIRAPRPIRAHRRTRQRRATSDCGSAPTVSTCAARNRRSSATASSSSAALMGASAPPRHPPCVSSSLVVACR